MCKWIGKGTLSSPAWLSVKLLTTSKNMMRLTLLPEQACEGLQTQQTSSQTALQRYICNVVQQGHERITMGTMSSVVESAFVLSYLCEAHHIWLLA